MNIDELIQSLEDQMIDSVIRIINISDEQIAALTPSDIIEMKNHFGGNTFMKLPEKEILFFEWLKKEDPDVWLDLWSNEEEAYIVSTLFLNQLTADANGFPICDLIRNDNYFFTERHIKIPDGVAALQEAIQKITSHKTLTVGEALLYEAYCAPIDIWRFAYRHHIPLQSAKNAVDTLDHAALLVHLTKSEDLIDYIDF